MNFKNSHFLKQKDEEKKSKYAGFSWSTARRRKIRTEKKCKILHLSGSNGSQKIPVQTTKEPITYAF